MTTVPVSFILDDGGPVNMYHFHDLGTWHELIIPPAFLKEFSKVCKRNNIMGKFSVVPMPAGLGRLDGKVTQVPTPIVKQYIKLIKEQIEPVFSITPEILTHYLAYKKPVLENLYISSCTEDEITEYISLALEILKNTGLNPTGVTSPWDAGMRNEDHYARGIGRAFRKIMNVDECFYFLHSSGDDLVKPVVMFDTPETGKVISVPNNIHDAFWPTQNPVTARQARQNVKKNIDEILSPDGKTGVMREFFEQGLPIVFISHWQSLYSDGRCIGLEGLDALTQRMNKVFGKQIEWMPMMELAKNHAGERK